MAIALNTIIGAVHKSFYLAEQGCWQNGLAGRHLHQPRAILLQEMRECAVRGLDGPGLFALDVHPQTWAHLPGYEEALARRAAHLETLKVGVCFGGGRLGCWSGDDL